MIREIDNLPPGAIGFSATGVVTAKDYENVIMPAVAAVAAMDLRVRLLYHFGPDFERFGSGAMWDDAVLGIRHALEWDRIAVVSDNDWVSFAVQAMHWLLPGRVRLFPNAELDAAREWISEPR
ncbi:MAG TPA: STAS/SEC14 domain-containing protein [Rhodanobacteraceae bacterium]|nr:STAS/SEC14 domain-containing protein [Rhodanobacteraceae bacterium]